MVTVSGQISYRFKRGGFGIERVVIGRAVVVDSHGSHDVYLGGDGLVVCEEWWGSGEGKTMCMGYIGMLRRVKPGQLSITVGTLDGEKNC